MFGSRCGVLAACLVLSNACTEEGEFSPLHVDVQEKRVVEGSPESVGLLDFLNDAETTFEVLDIEVGLDRRAAGNLIGHRDGGDNEFGTTDDDLFNSIDEVDSVRWVGPSALHKIADHAALLGFVPVGGDYLGTWDNVAFSVDEAEITVSWINRAEAWVLDEALGLDARAVESILTAGWIKSVAELSELYYVGESALRTIKEASISDLGFADYQE